MHAFEEAIRATASKHAPWFVVPADNKVVHPARGSRGDRGRVGGPRPHVPEGRRGEEERARSRAGGAFPRAVERF